MAFWIILFVSFLLLAVFFFYASYNISSGVYVKTFCRKKTTEKEIALTFDDGPDSEYTPQILNILKSRNVEAAFFCIGNKVEKNPELTKKIKEEGHLIGNHSYSHINTFPLFSANKMIEDIRAAEKAIESVTGEPVAYFRPPFGVTNPLIRKALKAFNYTVIGWNIRSLDTSSTDVDTIFNRIIRQVKPGSVILLHDTMPHTGQVLIKTLDYLADNGYVVKRVDKMFNKINE